MRVNNRVRCILHLYNSKGQYTMKPLLYPRRISGTNRYGLIQWLTRLSQARLLFLNALQRQETRGLMYANPYQNAAGPGPPRRQHTGRPLFDQKKSYCPRLFRDAVLIFSLVFMAAQSLHEQAPAKRPQLSGQLFFTSRIRKPEPKRILSLYIEIHQDWYGFMHLTPPRSCYGFIDTYAQFLFKLQNPSYKTFSILCTTSLVLCRCPGMRQLYGVR